MCVSGFSAFGRLECLGLESQVVIELEALGFFRGAFGLHVGYYKAQFKLCHLGFRASGVGLD